MIKYEDIHCQCKCHDNEENELENINLDPKVIEQLIKWARITNEVILPSFIQILIELEKIPNEKKEIPC